MTSRFTNDDAPVVYALHNAQYVVVVTQQRRCVIGKTDLDVIGTFPLQSLPGTPSNILSSLF